MRFIHTSDWHLGRIMGRFHLTDDQAHVLAQIERMLKDGKADALLVSGDVYDRGIPPPEAVGLLDDFCCRVSLGLGIPVVIIAGNHDSPERLSFGARLMAKNKLHVFCRPTAEPAFVDLADKHGPVRFYALPYAEPAEARQVLGDEAVRDHETAFARFTGDIKAQRPEGMRSVLLAHCFTAGATASDSERPLSVGGSGTVPAALFDDFAYAALGHLHRAQAAGQARYSGSLLKYSTMEAGHKKSVRVVDMDATGVCQVSELPLVPRRDLRVVEGKFDELLRGTPSDDFVHARMLDKGPVLDAANRLRKVYPHLLEVERVTPVAQAGAAGARDLSRLSEEELFRCFFKDAVGEAAEDAMVKVFLDAVEAVRLEAREAKQ